MPWNVNDIVLQQVKQLQYGQEIINTLFYRISDIVTGVVSPEIFDELAERIVDAMTVVQQDVLSHVEQVYDNLTDGITQYVSTYGKTGDGPSLTPAPSFVAVGMKKSVFSRITRPGSIRLAGLDDANYDGNDLEAAAAIAYGVLGIVLEDPVTINDLAGNEVSFQPVVVGRDPLGGFDLTRINDITTIHQPRVTTQNSRKPER